MMEDQRSFVSKIVDIREHSNADRLELAELDLGWVCIVEKGKYAPNDIVLYIAIDSIVPDNMIAKYGLDYLGKGGRVKTVKLRGVFSQGLILDLPPQYTSRWIGSSLDKELNIGKYEPGEVTEEVVGRFGRKRRIKIVEHPQFIKYSKIPHFVTVRKRFRPEDKIVVTEKLHGTNFRMGYLKKHKLNLWEKTKKLFQGNKFVRPVEFVFGSHNRQLGFYFKRNTKNVYARIAQEFKEQISDYEGYIFFGEIVGPGIQKGYDYNLTRLGLYIFDIYNVEKKEFINYFDMLAICHSVGLNMAPHIYAGLFDDFSKTRDFTPENMISVLGGNSVICEGYVIQNLTTGEKARAVSKEYLAQKNLTEYH